MATNFDNIEISENQESSLSRFIKVPLCFQETEYTCGVACVQSVLADYGIIYRQDVLSEMLKQKPLYGTDYHDIIHFLQTLGFQATFVMDMNTETLKDYIKDRISPILMIQAWKEDVIDYSYDWRDSHYAIACGYDENRIFFMDPYTFGNYTFIPIEELLKRWHLLDQYGNHLNYCGIVIKNENLKFVYNPEVIKYQA